MDQAISEMQQSWPHLDPAAAVGTGVVVVLAGLWFWLGGLSLAKVTAGICGAVAGVTLAYLLPGRGIAMYLILGFIGIGLGFVVESMVLLALAGLFVGAAAVVAVAGASPLPDMDWNYPDHNLIGSREKLDIDASFAMMKQDGIFVCRKAAEYLKNAGWAAAGAGLGGLVVTFGAGLIFRKLVTALGAASLGTAMVFSGMVMLLLQKGSEPITRIMEKKSFYLAAAGAMVAFGTLVQAMLVRRRKRKAQKAAGDQESRQGDQ